MSRDPNQRPSIKNFDDFVEECGMLPDGKEPDFAITNPLEMHFMRVAYKHGIIDAMIDEQWDEQD